MIVFNLQCRKGHGFDGWFKSGADFDRQAKRGLVECPACGSNKVEKALSAPRLAGTKKSRKAAASSGLPTTQAAMATDPAAAKLAEMHAQLAKLRAHVETNYEDVGEKFAEEARKIHYGESEKRDIYGETSADEAAALADEGVPVARIPWVRCDA
jgi:hypothetical protein